MGREPHSNWLDQLRLLFAALVIFSHSFALVGMVDPMFHLFGTIGFGGFSVCGFFILSGYLIASAWDRAPSLGPYLRNRVLRIVPAFAVAFVLSVMVAGALGSGDPPAYYRSLDWRRLTYDLLTLGPPTARFPTADNYQVNGAMWTIQLEFFCYLIAPAILMRLPGLLIAWASCAVFTAIHPEPGTAIWLAFPRFLLMFLSGALYWRLKIRAGRLAIIACAVALPLTLAAPALYALGLATAGTILLLTLGLKTSPLRLPDISYGTYLYGWPVQKLLIIAGMSNPLVLFPTALAISGLFGAASWYSVERYAQRLKRRSRALPDMPTTSKAQAASEVSS